MNDLIEKLITDYQARQWKSEPMDKALRLATSAPQDIAELVQMTMEKLPKGGSFLGAALAFLPDADWPELVSKAIKHLHANPNNEAAESVITYASLQCVQAVHPFLSDLFLIDEHFRPYYGAYAWRESGTTHVDFLAHQLYAAPQVSPLDAHCGDLRDRAFSALLETRHPDALALACATAPDLGYTPDQVRSQLLGVDHEQGQEGFRGLTPTMVWRLQFPSGYVERPDYLKGFAFPTWDIRAPNAYSYRFGGTLDTACGRCHQSLHHLLTLDPVPAGQGITSVPALTMATCLSCLGWEEACLFFQHDSAGQPHAYSPDAISRSPRFLTLPLLETQVAIVETPRRWSWQDWCLSNGRENLHRLGGHPCWVQSPQFPSCPNCAHTMPFLMQLDSGLQTVDEGYLLWGSGGIAYLFWCDACRISATRWQCT